MSPYITTITGHAAFLVEYTALFYRFFKSEVVDAVVTNVNDLLVTAKTGHAHVMVHRSNMAFDFKFEESAYVSADRQQEIRVGSVVRVVIHSVTFSKGEQVIKAVAAMNDDYLGVY